MARVETVSLVDDVTGEKADETVQFAVDGHGYEIDLSDANAQELRGALAGYVESARRLGRVVIGPRTRLSAARRPQPGWAHNQAVRSWAHANGHSVADRGRIPVSVVEAFERAQ